MRLLRCVMTRPQLWHVLSFRYDGSPINVHEGRFLPRVPSLRRMSFFRLQYNKAGQYRVRSAYSCYSLLFKSNSSITKKPCDVLPKGTTQTEFNPTTANTIIYATSCSHRATLTTSGNHANFSHISIYPR